VTSQGLSLLGEGLKRLKFLEEISFTFPWLETRGFESLSRALNGIESLKKVNYKFLMYEKQKREIS